MRAQGSVPMWAHTSLEVLISCFQVMRLNLLTKTVTFCKYLYPLNNFLVAGTTEKAKKC
jgi:hypothetical protein